jgi:hypothetical protein
MNKTTDLIAQLADPDEQKRWAAAEALRLTPSLPAEALFALKSATLDRNAAVAASARAALAAHENPSPAEKRPNAVRSISAAFQPRQGIKPKSEKDARRTGALFLLLAAVLGYFGIFRPISEALHGAPSITYYAEAPVLTVFVAIGGLSMVLFGIKGWAFLQGPTQRGPRILFFVTIVILTLACYFAMQYVMRSLGYR